MTFKAAKAKHLKALRDLGWSVSEHLKVPHATSPDGRTRIYFKAQAVYAAPDGKPLGIARSTHADPRVTSTDQLIRDAVDTADFLRTL